MQNERPIAAYNVGAVPRDVMRIFCNDRRLEEVRSWLDAGGDPNAVEYHTPGINGVQLNILSRAANCGATAVVRLLLERGADPNKGTGSDGSWGTAVHWGAGNRWATAELIEALVAHGGDVNAVEGMCGNTPLLKTIDDIRFLPPVNAVVALLRAGADPAARDCCGHTAECNAIGLINPSYSMRVQAGFGVDSRALPQSPEEYYHAKAMRDLLQDVRLAGGTWRAYLDTTRHPLAVLKTLCERKRALVRAGRTRRSTPAEYALLFSSAVPQEIFGKVLSYVYFGPSSTTPPRPWDPSRDERGDTEYWRVYFAKEGWPVPDCLDDVPFGDPKELPGWVDREDESTGDY